MPAGARRRTSQAERPRHIVPGDATRRGPGGGGKGRRGRAPLQMSRPSPGGYRGPVRGWAQNCRRRAGPSVAEVSPQSRRAARRMRSGGSVYRAIRTARPPDRGVTASPAAVRRHPNNNAYVMCGIGGYGGYSPGQVAAATASPSETARRLLNGVSGLARSRLSTPIPQKRRGYQRITRSKKSAGSPKQC